MSGGFNAQLEAELGEDVLSALNDPSVVEIMLNPSGVLYAERLGEGMSVIGSMSGPNGLSLLGTVAHSLGTVINPDSPIVEGELSVDGSRIEGLIPPIVSAPAFTIRKKASSVFTLKQYVATNVMTEKQASQIVEGVSKRRNILVAGGTGSGKTTLVNAIIQAITEIHPDDRLVLIEDTAEIQCSAQNSVQLHTSQFTDMQALLRATMRMRPDRILVGEVRGAEALTLLKSWNTGHPGGVATVHANGAQAALVRLAQLVAESGMVIDTRPLIKEAVDIVIAIEKTATGRRVTEIFHNSEIEKNE